jgi:hypothetical protein
MARETRETWAKRVEQWERSGLSGAEFAAQRGLKEATLRHWKWQLGHGQRAKSRGAEFIEVVADARALAGEARELEVVVGGVRVVVPKGFDEETLRRLLRVVEGR